MDPWYPVATAARLAFMYRLNYELPEASRPVLKS